MLMWFADIKKGNGSFKNELRELKQVFNRKRQKTNNKIKNHSPKKECSLKSFRVGKKGFKR